MKSDHPVHSDSELEELPDFKIPLNHRIVVVRSPQECKRAIDCIVSNDTVGFDTETNPNSESKGCGPHIFQFSLLSETYIFQSSNPDTHNGLIYLITNKRVKKVGFDLKSDRKAILKEFGVSLGGEMDLSVELRKRGYGKSKNVIGIKRAIRILLGQSMTKQKSVTMSDWDSQSLSTRQLIYAASDSYGALLCHNEMENRDCFQ